MGKLKKSINPVLRAIGVIGVIAGLVTAVTFAALNSQATLTANTLSSATADLKIDNADDNSCSPTTNTAAGFAFTNIAPGEQSETHIFCLKNDGGVDLDVTVYATPSTTTGVVDNSKIDFCFTRITPTPGTEVCYTRAEMLANFNNLPDNSLATDDGEVRYNVVVKVDADHPGSGFSVAAFDLVFTGTQTALVDE